MYFLRIVGSPARKTIEIVHLEGEVIQKSQKVGALEFSNYFLRIPVSMRYDAEKPEDYDFAGDYWITSIRAGFNDSAVVLRTLLNDEEIWEFYTDTPSDNGDVEAIRRYSNDEEEHRNASRIWE